jgi:hypothetical protein
MRTDHFMRENEFFMGFRKTSENRFRDLESRKQSVTEREFRERGVVQVWQLFISSSIILRLNHSLVREEEGLYGSYSMKSGI